MDATWCPGLDPGTEKEYERKNWGRCETSWALGQSNSTPTGLVSRPQHGLLDVLQSDTAITVTAATINVLNARQTHSHTTCHLILPAMASILFHRWDVEQREVQSFGQGHPASNCRSPELNLGSLASVLTLCNYHAWSMEMPTDFTPSGMRKLH